jgi:hypothetical protein
LPAVNNPCLKYTPQDWWLVGNLDCKRFFDFLLKVAAQQPDNPNVGMMNAYLAVLQGATGIDFRSQVDELSFFAAGDLEAKPTFVVVIHGTFNNSSAEMQLGMSIGQASVASTYKGVTLHEKGQVEYCLPSPSTLVVGSPALVREAVDQVAPGRGSAVPQDLKAVLERTDGGSLIWLAARPKVILETPSLREWRGQHEAFSRNLSAVQSMSLSFTGDRDGLLVNAKGYLNDSQAAKDLQTYLDKRKSDLLAREGANVFMCSFLIMSDVGSEGPFVNGTLRLTMQSLQELWQTKLILHPGGTVEAPSGPPANTQPSTAPRQGLRARQMLQPGPGGPMVEPVKETDGSTSATVEFANGGRITLGGFGLDDGPLVAPVGDSKMTVAFNRVASIEIQSSRPGTTESVTMAITPSDGSPQITITDGGGRHLRGYVVDGDISYVFHTRLSMCKRIILTPSHCSVKPGFENNKVCYRITSKNGSTLTLSDIQAFTIHSEDTGYVQTINNMPIWPLKKDVNISADHLSLPVTNGFVDIPLFQIKTFDMVHGLLDLRNDHTIHVFKPEESAVDRTFTEDCHRLCALAGWVDNQYMAIEYADIREIAAVEGKSGSAHTSPTPPEGTSYNIAVTDTKGTTQRLEEATIESPFGDLAIGRILMDRCRPFWHATSDGHLVISAAEYRSCLAAKQDEFWRIIPISEIKAWTMGKDGKGRLALRSGRILSDARLEFGEIRGTGTLGEINYSPSSIASFVVEE